MTDRYRTSKEYDGMQVTAETEDEVLDWLMMEYQKSEVDHYFLYTSHDGNVSITGQYGQYIFRGDDGNIFLVDDPSVSFEKLEVESNG